MHTHTHTHHEGSAQKNRERTRYNATSQQNILMKPMGQNAKYAKCLRAEFMEQSVGSNQFPCQNSSSIDFQNDLINF